MVFEWIFHEFLLDPGNIFLEKLFLEIKSFTLIRWGDGLFDSIRLDFDNCSVDIFVLDGGGGGGGSVGFVWGGSNLSYTSFNKNKI